MSLVNHLDRPIAYHRIFVVVTGTVAGAVYLSQALYWEKRKKDKEWWYKTGIDWTEETGLKRGDQDSSRKKLVELGVMETRNFSIPRKKHFKLNLERLNFLLELVSEKEIPDCKILQTELLNIANSKVKDSKLDGEEQQDDLQDVTNSSATTLQTSTETTTETTNTISRDDVYKIKKDWQPDLEILHECLNPEIPDDFRHANTKNWVSYWTDSKNSKSRSHQIWHETFARHVENRWDIQKKKSKSKTPSWQINGFASEADEKRSRDEIHDRKLAQQLIDDGKPLPKYLEQYAEVTA